MRALFRQSNHSIGTMRVLFGGVLPLLTGTALYAAYTGPPLALFSVLEPGQWQFREHGKPAGAARLVCLGDPLRFIQIAHGEETCNTYVINNSAHSLSVAYKCPGRGHGTTEIRMETSRLIQLRTQGIRDSAPFAIEMEGRRIGRC